MIICFFRFVKSRNSRRGQDFDVILACKELITYPLFSLMQERHVSYNSIALLFLVIYIDQKGRGHFSRMKKTSRERKVNIIFSDSSR